MPARQKSLQDRARALRAARKHQNRLMGHAAHAVDSVTRRSARKANRSGQILARSGPVSPARPESKSTSGTGVPKLSKDKLWAKEKPRNRLKETGLHKQRGNYMTTEVAVQLNEQQARAITNKIRSRTEELWVLVKAAYDGKAWKALGYHGWGDYARTEFDVSRSRAYQLIDQAKVITELKKVSTNVDISEAQARAIKPVIKEVAAEIKAKIVAGADPVETTYAVIEARRVDPPKTSKPVEKPEPANEEGPTLSELVDELQAENVTLRKEVAALKSELGADDLRVELAKAMRLVEHHKHEHGIAMDRAARAADREKWVVKLLRRCAKAVGVADPAHTDPRDIAKAVEEYAGVRHAARA